MDRKSHLTILFEIAPCPLSWNPILVIENEGSNLAITAVNNNTFLSQMNTVLTSSRSSTMAFVQRLCNREIYLLNQQVLLL